MLQSSCPLPEKYPLERVLPHRGKMALLDEIVRFDRDGESLTAAFAGRREWTGNYTAIEYMAQAAAALAGSFDLDEGWRAEPRPGFLIGARRLELSFDAFEPGVRYLVTASKEFSDSETASFRCEIKDSRTDATIAAATLNAYRPPADWSLPGV